jgi:hypothetical protein
MLSWQALTTHSLYVQTHADATGCSALLSAEDDAVSALSWHPTIETRLFQAARRLHCNYSLTHAQGARRCGDAWRGRIFVCCVRRRRFGANARACSVCRQRLSSDLRYVYVGQGRRFERPMDTCQKKVVRIYRLYVPWSAQT